MSRKIEYVEDESGEKLPYAWNPDERCAIIHLDDGSQIIARLETDISDEMSRWVALTSPEDNVGEVRAPFGDSMHKPDSLMRKLLNKGFVFGSKDVVKLLLILSKLGVTRNRDTYYHTQKGIVEIKGKVHVLGRRNYTNSSASFRNSVYRQNEKKSKRNRNAPKENAELIVTGDEKTLLKGLKELVLGKDAIELVFITGAVGLVGKELSKRHRISNPIISIVGKAFKGKDSILLIPASVWTLPDNLTTGTSTQAGLRKFILDEGILPLVGNDVTVRCKKHLEETISAFADGRGLETHFSSKTRHFIVLHLSSNVSILQMGNKGEHNGYATRVFEFRREQFTEDAQHAEAIAKWVGECHGVASERILNYLAKLPDLENTIIDAYEATLSNFKMSHPDVNGRQAQMIALILTTGQLVAGALGVEFNLDAICEMLVEASFKTTKNHEAMAVHEEVMRLFKEKTDSFHFFDGDYKSFEPEKHIGIIDGDTIYIHGSHIKSCDFSGNRNKEIKEWLISQGLMLIGNDDDSELIKESRGMTHRITRISGDKKTFYAFKIA